MPRQLKIATKELGELRLYLIYEKEGVWEGEWTALQKNLAASILTMVDKDLMEAALRGYTLPLVKLLGLNGELAIRKLPLIDQVCNQRMTCKLFDHRQCVPTHPKMPWCFQPAGGEDEVVRERLATVIQLWREGNYIIVVRE
jgi:hypothetical protein